MAKFLFESRISGRVKFRLGFLLLFGQTKSKVFFFIKRTNPDVVFLSFAKQNIRNSLPGRLSRKVVSWLINKKAARRPLFLLNRFHNFL